MPKTPTLSKPAAQAAVVSTDNELARLQAAVVGQFQIMRRLRGEETVRGLVVGLALVRMQKLLPYGHLGRWTKANIVGYSERYVAYLKRLGETFIDETRLSAPELGALPDDKSNLQLTTMEGAQRRLMQKALKFVGEKSLHELFEEHGIKTAPALGGARAKPARAGDAPDAEQLYLFARDEIGGVIQRAEELFLTENRLQYLAGHPEEVRGAVESLRSLADKVEKAAQPFLKKS